MSSFSYNAGHLVKSVIRKAVLDVVRERVTMCDWYQCGSVVGSYL